MQKDRLHTFIATGFYIGKIPFAPGTFGSLLAVGLWVVVNHYFFAISQNFILNILMWLILILASFFIGAKSSSYYCKQHKKNDAGEVVIDEICGQWITLLIVCLASGVIGSNMVFIHLNYLVCIIFAFILFRIFDISKPWFIGKIDKKIKNGWGVMLDDVAAGFCGGLAFVLFKIILSFIKL